MNVHKVVVALMLLEVALLLSFGLSYRSYEFDWLLVSMLLITGLVMFFTIRKRVNIWKRIYLFLYPIYISVLVIAFMMERILFIVLMIPLWLFILPNEAKVQQGGYAIRDHPTIMGQAEVDLYKNYFLLERKLQTIDVDPLEFISWENLKVVDSAGQIIAVNVTLDGRDTTLRLKPD